MRYKNALNLNFTTEHEYTRVLIVHQIKLYVKVFFLIIIIYHLIFS